MGRQIEKNLVLKPCLNACEWLLRQGVIIEYRRLDESDKDHQLGAPDIEIRFVKNDMLWLILCECKKPGGGVHLESQKKYQTRYTGLLNVLYIIVENVAELKNVVEIMTGFYQKKIDDITLDTNV